ncbi:MAG: PLP-dependent aminotransferase family protein [Desulfopila sp.]
MEKNYLYRELTRKISLLIENGTFRPGDRVPSIRQLSRQERVSVNTVKMAYSHLEDQGIVEARPQAGYFVCPPVLNIPREPEVNHYELSPLDISSSELVARIMLAVLDPGKIQFGAAIPDPSLVPAVKLSRIIASETRKRRLESTGYVMPPGNRRLRGQIAKWMIRSGCTLNPDEIVITSGAAEAVFLALKVICRPNDTVAIGSPVYFNFIEMLKMLELKVVEIPNSPTEGLQLDGLRQALHRHKITCCLVISNFNNPLGNSMSDQRKREMVRIVTEAGVPLIEDDINGDLAHDDDRPSVAKAWDRKGNVLLCSSFSKTLAPGYRVGWIAPGRYRDEVMRAKLVTNIATATPTQLAIAEFLENGGYARHLRTIRKAYAQKLGRLAEAIGEYFPSGTRVTRPSGGFTLWLELPGNTSGLRLYAMAAREKITVAPGTIFSISGKYANCIRLNGAFWSEENRWAVRRLGSLAAQLQSQA